MKASDDAVLLPAIRRLRRGELALRCGLSAREAIDSTDPTAVLTGARTVGSEGAALPSRHAPAPRPLSAAHGPGPLPKLLRGHAPPVGGQVSRPARLSLQLRRRRSRGRVTVFCVFEADFDDAAALSAARASPEGQAVRADVPHYATGGAVVLDYELRAG